MFRFYVAIVLALTYLVRAFPYAQVQADSVDASAASAQRDILYSFPTNQAPENLVVRPSGALLITIRTQPLIVQVDPSSKTNNYKEIYRFPNRVAALGIVDLGNDVYAVAAGNGSAAPPVAGAKGTWAVFTVDLSGSTPKVTKKADVPNAGVLDGMALLNAQQQTLVATDPFDGGALYFIDLKAGTSRSLLSDSTTGGNNDPNNPFRAVGANGLKVRNSRLYYTNSARGTLYYVPVDASAGKLTGSPVSAFNYGVPLDDFSFAGSGNAYITAPTTGIIRRNSGTADGKNGSTYVSTLASTNAVVIGPAGYGQCTLYAVASGSPPTANRLSFSGSC